MKYNFDMKKLSQQVSEVISYSQHFDFISEPLKIEALMSDWLNAKREFIEKMQGNLIHETNHTISFHLDERSRRERLEKFADVVRCHYGNENLSEFLYSLPTQDFYNNKTSQDYLCNLITVPKNFKVIKSFKFFEGNNEILQNIQNEASRIIQEDTVSGRLCFSVHPLDFLSASENVHNWRSCYALDGEFRCGNLFYLMDKGTVLCYLKAESEDVKLPHFPESVPWNSKKWRVWLFFSNDKNMVFASKQYPFTNDLGIDYIKSDLFPEIGLLNYYGNMFKANIRDLEDTFADRNFHFNDKMYPVGYGLKPLRELMRNGHKTYVYNDILENFSYDPIYFYKESDSLWGPTTGDTNERTLFTVGEECPCPICGGDNMIAYSDIMACDRCANNWCLCEADEEEEYDEWYYCDCCGVSISIDEAFRTDFTDEVLCESCYNAEVVSCDICFAQDYRETIKCVNGLLLCPDCRRSNNWNQSLRKSIAEIKKIKIQMKRKKLLNYKILK